jgi:hypothetical protein
VVNTVLVLAVATVLAAGLTVLPSSVQEAQANPCSADSGVEANGGEDGDGSPGGAAGGSLTTDQECKFIGNLEDAFDED